ncbi:HIRAN domain-containing protein [Jeotgalibacillus sp. R-1-5s-1]|uniref:HIRAN domain-containing protein n=1 Tax=Jeotgalibacillus sp. R-1-5s-1 TaxID=2555897 RepID=UPI00106AFA07|nr:HIRAN domain-containing protein [Jeotgalibacillus sp. R-1-5s-1]TFD99509.1 HIRAN domain-containing protein [Jeotgalibacillus sp. R-1-5s-1]
MPRAEEKLLVSWKGPKSKTNYFVGLLSKKDDVDGPTYTFLYNKEIVEEAENEGFAPFIGLKDVDKEYKSKKLFPVFERRLPNQSRNVFQKFIHANNLHESNTATWEYLKITMGKTATDRLSFLEPVYIEDGKLSYTGQVAGWSFTMDENPNLKVNSEILLRIDHQNKKDPMAVEVLDPNNEYSRVGYIQKPFNKVFFNLLTNGHSFTGYIKSVDSYDGRPLIAIEESIPNHLIIEHPLPYLVETQ